MPYGAYTQRLQVTVAAGATLAVDNPMEHIPDEVTIVTVSGDAELEVDNWAADGSTFDATNPGSVENTSELVLVYRHSVSK